MTKTELAKLEKRFTTGLFEDTNVFGVVQSEIARAIPLAVMVETFYSNLPVHMPEETKAECVRIYLTALVYPEGSNGQA